ncbi:MAG: M48 family metalloprotease, partial [Muribaculaceae bacterium]|nr:M48 family metalloprotease [Muribaculaceae bacterium]
TLIEQLTPDEIVAVLSHELGHYSHHDTITGMIKSIAMIAVYMFTFSLFVSNQQLPVALGGQYPSFVLSLFAFLLLITPINLVIDVVFNIMSRRAEYRADAFATRLGHGEQLISGLKKLSANTLSNLTPHPVVVFVEYSHPTLAQRIIAINNIMK